MARVPRVNVVNELLANNEAFAKSLPVLHLDVRPRRQLAIVTCMDSRLDVFAALGLRNGDAHILRNAGGVITDDVIRSLAVSQRRLGTREVMLIHHTDCGMQSLTDDGFRAELQEATGTAPSFAIESFTDVEENVRQSLLRVTRSEFLLHRDLVRGFVYDVDRTRCTRSAPPPKADAGPDRSQRLQERQQLPPLTRRQRPEAPLRRGRLPAVPEDRLLQTPRATVVQQPRMAVDRPDEPDAPQRGRPPLRAARQPVGPPVGQARSHVTAASRCTAGSSARSAAPGPARSSSRAGAQLTALGSPN